MIVNKELAAGMVFCVVALTLSILLAKPSSPNGWYRAGESLQTMAEGYSSYIVIEDSLRGIPTLWHADVILEDNVFDSCEVEDALDLVYDGQNRFHAIVDADGRPLSGRITRFGIIWDSLPERFSMKVRSPLPQNTATNLHGAEKLSPSLSSFTIKVATVGGQGEI